MKVLLFKALVAATVATVASLPAVAAITHKTIANNQPDAIYVAHLAPLNTKVTGQAATGEARFTIKGDPNDHCACASGTAKHHPLAAPSRLHRCALGCLPDQRGRTQMAMASST